jgi:hypothetical protein
MIESLSFSAFGTLGSPFLSKCLDQPRFSDILIICVASVHLYILFKYNIVNKRAFVVFNVDFLAVNFKLAQESFYIKRESEIEGLQYY